MNSKFRTLSFLLLLTALMAMGNWINTPSPPVDPDAPEPVGNEGELTLDIDGATERYLVHSARLSDSELHLSGEPVQGHPLFTLELVADEQAGRGRTFEVGSGFVEALGTVAGGSVEVIAWTGDGPWELDAEVTLRADSGDTCQGTLKARVRAS